MPTVSRKLDDQFLSATVRATVPVAIWGVHFFAAYWAVSFACELGLQHYAVAGISWITVALWALTAAAIGVLIAMIAFDGRRVRAYGERDGVRKFVQISVAVFALIGVIWSTVPLWAAAPCANPYEFSRPAQ